MENRYVNVTIERETPLITVAGSGKSVIVAFGAVDVPYKEYLTLESVMTDYPSTTDAYKVAQAIFNNKPRVERVGVFTIGYDVVNMSLTELVQAAETVIKENADFMFLHVASNDDEIITAFSNYNVDHERLLVATTEKLTLVDTLKANENTFLVVTKQADKFLASAAIGAVASYEIGEYTLTFTSLHSSIQADKWTPEELDIIEKGGAAYIREGGKNIISKGVTTNGTYVDVLLGQYYLKNRITEAIYHVLTTHKKVPYNDRGIALIQATLETVLKQAATQGVIAVDANDAPIYTVTAPLASEVSDSNKAQRILPDVRFEAEIGNGIEKTVINGLLAI